MTKKEVLKKLLECHEIVDPKTAHEEADKVLCEFLISLGYDDVVAEFDKVYKWYD